jgi:hypothetical protein
VKEGLRLSRTGLFTHLPRSSLLGNPLGLLGNDEAPGLFTEGFYRYSILSSSLDVSNHHLNLLLAQRFIFCLRDRLEPLRALAI